MMFLIQCPLLCPDNFPAGCKNPVPSAAPARLSCLLLQVAPGLGVAREREGGGGRTHNGEQGYNVRRQTSM